MPALLSLHSKGPILHPWVQNITLFVTDKSKADGNIAILRDGEIGHTRLCLPGRLFICIVAYGYGHMDKAKFVKK